MFTRTIRSQMLLGKSGVRWELHQISDIKVDLGTNVPLIEPKILSNIKSMPADIQETILENRVSQLSMKELIGILRFLQQGKQGSKKKNPPNNVSQEIERKNAFIKIIQTELDARKVKETEKNLFLAAASPAASVQFREDVAAVVDGAHNDTVKALPQEAPAVSTNGASRPVENLKNDPKVTALVDTYNEQYVNRRDLLQALSRAITNFGPYDKVYERVTGEKPSESQADVEKFQKALNTNIGFLQQFGGGTAGLDALLSGKIDLYLTQVAANQNSIKTIRPPEGTISPQTQTIAGAAATVLVGVATSGIVMVGHEADRVEADAFIQKFKKDAEGGIGNTLGNALVWVKEALMGRKLSITLGANDKEGNVDAYYDKIRTFTEKVMKTSNLSQSTDPEISSMYLAAKGFAEKVNIPPTDERFKKALIQSYILNEGFARQGVDWKANIGLLFIGAGREAIDVRTVRGEGNDTERNVVKRTIDTNELKSVGIRIAKNADGKWVHTIPASIQFSGDIDPTPVSYDLSVKSQDNNIYTIVTDMVQMLHFSERNGVYVLTISDAKNQPSSDATQADANGDRNQIADSVRNIREKMEKLSFADKLYFIGHTDPVVFSPLLRALGAQDEAGVRLALQSLQKTKYKAIAVQLQKDIPTLMQVGNTYTYGTSKHRSVESVKQTEYNSMRTTSVLAAESRLARLNGITGVTPESAFQSEKYSPKQISRIYAGQEMTVACFATPLADGKTGVHRIDTMDGSFAVHERTVDLSGDYKNQVIDSMAKLVRNDERGIPGQVQKLNLFLKSTGLGKETGTTTNVRGDEVPQIVTQQQYIYYLKTGDISNLGVPGLQLQTGKGTRVFEARAMIAGNVCLNRTHGIVYPLFETATQKQSADTVVSLDYSTPTKVTEVDASKTAIGVNPIAVAVNLKNSHDGSSQGGGTETRPGDGGEVVRPVTPQPVVTQGPINPGVTPPSITPGTIDVL